jgi:hypothetical protein
MNKGIVYKIEVGDELYIGSTEQILCARQRCHNRDLKSFPHRKLYKACIDNGVDKIKCWWVADIVFNSYAERRAIEETYRKQLNAELNTNRCYTSQEEIKEQQKQYRLGHKEEKKQYRLDHKEKIAEYKKQYNIDHKEEIAEYQKQYKIANRDAINARRREKRKEKKLLIEQSLSNNNNDQSNIIIR